MRLSDFTSRYFTSLATTVLPRKLTRTVTATNTDHHHWLIILGRDSELLDMAWCIISELFCYLSGRHFRSRFSQEEIC